MVAHWLMKSEPHVYPWEQLVEDEWTHWDGVRNYQARNTMRDDMKVGDFVLFYHSNTKPPGIIGVVDIVKESYVDHTQFDPKDPHYDPKSSTVWQIFWNLFMILLIFRTIQSGAWWM